MKTITFDEKQTAQPASQADALIRAYIAALLDDDRDKAAEATRQMVDYALGVEPLEQPGQEPVAWNDENVIAYCVKRGIKAAQEYTTTQPKPAAQPAQQPDLSRLMPATQAAIRSWLADGTFVERAIGVMHEQEAEIMRMQGRELKLQFVLQAEKPAPQPDQEPVATVVEELGHDGQGWCAKVRWLYNPVPVGETLSWRQPK